MDRSKPKKAKYGKKGLGLSEASKAIFGHEFTPPPTLCATQEPFVNATAVSEPATIKSTRKPRERVALRDVTELLQNVTLEEAKPILTPVEERVKAEPLPRRTSPRRPVSHVLDEVTDLLQDVRLDEGTSILGTTPKARTPPQPQRRSLRHRCSGARSRRSAPKREDERLEWLKPLIDAYQASGDPDKERLSVQKWDTLLDADWTLNKIAESSFAEVFKVTNEYGTSILKLMALRPPKGPGSQRQTAIPVEMVLSEVLIMNMMADLDGFVEFKEAHIIEGKPPKALADAFDTFANEKETFFPKPSSYPRGQLFLALELEDAGTDVEHFETTTAAQLWDIFLGVVTALATGEQAFGFEHRDLHEGNVCLRQVFEPQPLPKTSTARMGYSGLEVTLLDYTLSRAESEDEVIYLDLEADPEVFAESDVLQRQMYRRMRNWVYFRTYGTTHPLFDSEEAPQHGSWEMFEPYTNVIWLWYILDYTIQHFGGSSKDRKRFLKETEELRELLHPDKRSYDGGFSDALGVYDYCLDQGWILEE